MPNYKYLAALPVNFYSVAPSWLVSAGILDVYNLFQLAKFD